MHTSIRKADLYIDLVFPVYLVLNLFTMTTFCYVPEGEKAPVFVLIVKLLRYLIYVLSLANFTLMKFKRKELRLAILVLGTLFISLIANHDTEYFCYFLVFLALLDADRERIIKEHFWITLFFVLTVILLSQFGLIEDVVTSDKRQRHFLGFNWVTYPPVLLLFLVFDRVYINKGRIRLHEMLGFSLSGLWLYIKTNSRFAFSCTLASLLFFFVFNTSHPVKKRARKKNYVLCIVPMLCLLASYVVARVYSSSNPTMVMANDLLSQRLRLMHEAVSTYPVKLIGGQVIKWQGFNKDFTGFNGYNYVDNSYIQLLLQYGLFLVLLVIAFYSIGIAAGINANKRYLSWVLVIICIYCVMEPYLIRFTFNPFVWLGVEIVKPILKKDKLNYPVRV